MCLAMFLFGGPLHFLDLGDSFPKLGRFSAICLQIFSRAPFPLQDPSTANISVLDVVPGVLFKITSFHSFPFFLFSSGGFSATSFCLHYYLYVSGRLVTFLDLRSGLCVGSILAVYSSLPLPKLCVLGFPSEGSVGLYAVAHWGLMALVWLGVVTQGGPRASAASLVGRIRVTKTPGAAAHH